MTRFPSKTGGQLEGTAVVCTPRSAERSRLPESVEELILLGGVAGITSESQGKKTQGRTAADRSQQLASAAAS